MQRTHAIIRHLADSYPQCLVQYAEKEPIQLALARKQHAAYLKTLTDLGLNLIELPADPALPDCCFIEDAGMFFPELVFLCKMAEPSRAVETESLLPVFQQHFSQIYSFESPATIDGGDVLVIEKDIFVGLSSRTNKAALQQMERQLTPFGYRLTGVEVKGALHLKSCCTYLGQGCLIMAEGHLDQSIFQAYQTILLPPAESYTANCLAINGKVLIPAGFPKAAEKVHQAGFETISLEMSEFRKGDGSLTCLSILF